MKEQTKKLKKKIFKRLFIKQKRMALKQLN